LIGSWLVGGKSDCQRSRLRENPVQVVRQFRNNGFVDRPALSLKPRTASVVLRVAWNLFSRGNQAWNEAKTAKIGERGEENRSQVEYLAMILDMVWHQFSSALVPRRMPHYTSAADRTRQAIRAHCRSIPCHPVRVDPVP
jgi:hypothetical protein